MQQRFCITLLLLFTFLSGWTQTPNDSVFVQKKRFGRAAAELFVVQLLPWSYDKFITKADWAKLSIKSIGSNLNPKNWEWDDNSFKTNQFGHPYHGNLYYSTFRTNGYSFWQSAPAAVSGSFIWEVAAETNKFAPNDFINTSLGGIALGEMTYRLSRKIVNNRSRGAKRQAQEVFGLIVSPLNGVNRILNGEWGKVHGMVDTAQKLTAYINIGSRHFNIKTYQQNLRGREEIYLRLRLIYGEKFEESETPFEHFSTVMELGNGDSTYINNLQVSGALKTWPMQSAGDGRHLYTVTMNYDFIKNNAFQYGGQSFTFKLMSNWNEHSKIKFTSEIGSGIVALGAVQDKYLYYGEGRNYDYGVGIMMTAGGTINFNNLLEAEFNYKGSRFETVNGNPSSYILNTLAADVRGFLGKRFSLAAGVGQYTLNGFFKGFDNVAEVYPFARFSLGYKL
ncbi:DUF3943 domain-containing protein [Mucilaginibacter sp. ZT4R22]|uniref:DUF3943 domain-containing protein n=1 Tax=Mucilaginibacter pankratovii TaxID=2772110 RepID=A0ABR7WJZ8_9SPHI|nr:DUF3943 domain-containing protein [Mucilaginibacter pankratovii]MBD1362641.1 DUF3943 domain-containing protein [Mucilaginibacter pankratovii]